MKTAHTIEQWPVERLVPYDRNARTHSEAQVAQIAASIREFGFNNPILVDAANGIIAGHGRLQAARKMGLATVPVIVLDHLSEAQRRAYILADNKLAMNAGWDEELLLAELRDLDEMIDLSLTGFDANELERMFAAGDDDGRADECPDAPETPVTRRSDLWLLGRHRVLCGDATSAEDVARLMDGAKADMVFTDPPYNADYSSRVDKNRRKPWGGILNDAMPAEEYDCFLADVLAMMGRTTVANGSIYCCIDWKRYPQLARPFAAMLAHKATIVWDKKHFGLGTYYRTQYELILFGTNGDKPHIWTAEREERDVWSVSRETVSEYVHPTQKPVEIIERAIRNSSTRDAAVLDLFGGSGSTLIACEKANRRARVSELDPKYCDVIVNRWQEFTGQTAALDGDGRTFAAVARERAGN